MNYEIPLDEFINGSQSINYCTLYNTSVQLAPEPCTFHRKRIYMDMFSIQWANYYSITLRYSTARAHHIMHDHGSWTTQPLLGSCVIHDFWSWVCNSEKRLMRNYELIWRGLTFSFIQYNNYTCNKCNYTACMQEQPCSLFLTPSVFRQNPNGLQENRYCGNF